MRTINLENTPVTTTTKLEGLSNKYTHINTAKLIEIAERQGFRLASVRYPKSRNSKEHSRHIIRLDVPGFESLDVKTERPQLVIDNSHDGSSALRIMAGVYRLVCSNGLVAGTSTMNYKLRHIGLNQIDIERQLEIAAKEVFKILPIVADFKDRTLNNDDALQYALQALIIRGKASGLDDNELHSLINLNDRLGIQNVNKVLNTRRHEDRDTNLWTIFNRVQENCVRNSGLMYLDRDGKYRRLYSVNGIQANTKLNQELWELTENQLKKAG